MRSKASWVITTIIQTIYLLGIALNYLFTWMVTIGVPYTFPFAIVGQVLILLSPIEILCIIPNIVFLAKDIKVRDNRSKIILRFVIAFSFFIVISLLKVGLYFYGSTYLTLLI